MSNLSGIFHFIFVLINRAKFQVNKYSKLNKALFLLYVA